MLRHTSVIITDKYYSNFVLNDIVEVINDSPLIKKNLTPTLLMDKAIKAFLSVIENDPRINIEIENNNSGEIKIFTKLT